MAAKPKTGVDIKKADKDADEKSTDKATDKAADVVGAEALQDDAKTDGPKHSFLTRLYTGTGAFEVVGRRRLWYGISGAIMAIAVLAILIRGFTFGIDFKGGTTVSLPAAGATGTIQVAQVQDVFKRTIGND